MPQLAAQRRLAALARHTAGGHANAVAAESTAEARRRAQELVRKEQEAAAQKLQDEQQANLQGGFGVLEPDTSGYFTLVQQDEALEFFRQEGYCCILDALSPSEVAHLNEFCDRTQETDPKAWGIKRNREGYHINQGLIYSQPWLDNPELDQYAVNHPSFKHVVEGAMGGPDFVRTYEFNFRESPDGAGRMRMGYHHDSVAQNRGTRDPYFPLDAMCCIRYLTDVTPETPAFAVVPRSRRHEGLDNVRGELQQQYKEVPIYAPAGTAVLYDNGTYHTRLDGTAEPSLGRRTLHQYFARGGWDNSTTAGMRPPTPPQTDWNVYPKRLAMHEDPAVRLQFSHWNSAMCEWAASDWSDEVRSNMPRAHTYRYDEDD